MVGEKATSERYLSGGSLGNWGGTSVQFSVPEQMTHCECCHFSIICSGGYICRSRADWPFPLIVSTEGKKFSHTPRSYFHVSVGRLVHFLVEVQSDKNQGDRYRMLLQAACAARLGRLVCNKPFIVVALYIENTGKVTRYLLFQRDDDDSTVCTFEFKQSCILSQVLIGFLCLGHVRLDETIRVV